ncbi:MAG: 2,3-bisphosphoglycerate-independent phosphoglycerate mutase [Vampirovibrionales bacterium]
MTTVLTQTVSHTPLVLLILDGWGLSQTQDSPGNAIELAPATWFKHLLATKPHVPIQASESFVGLPEGQIGNSEVGHMTFGAGRVLYQELTKINKHIADGLFEKNEVLLEAMAVAKKRGTRFHVMGLASPGGVHSHEDHLIALLKIARHQGLSEVYVHAFLDGRDVPPKSAEASLRRIEETLLDLDFPQIATIHGRYYAMDRDNRWERVRLAYETMVRDAEQASALEDSGNMTAQSHGRRHLLSLNALHLSYEQNVLDEFVLPAITDLTYDGMKDGDVVVFINFRPDRAREITAAFVDPQFQGFERSKVLKDLHFVCMTPYDSKLASVPVAFPKEPMVDFFPEVIAKAGLTQLRIAETEKYAHVTYFFSGGKEACFEGETRLLVDSPRIATYDLQPAMSLPEVKAKLVDAIQNKRYDVMICNFANPDMVGHCGKLEAAIEAVKAVDSALKEVCDAVESVKGTLFVSADHGNIEQMFDEHGGEHTAHTINPVPFVMVGQAEAQFKFKHDARFSLANVAPTLLTVLGLPIPQAMTASSMLEPAMTQPSVSH